ncbi:hypothetical protein [Neisseria sp. Ec49-e6-T10]|uniref:hypothetical protein n=1 Tax=Neisseria sp. Ec49-e6-T10 TaxID=3140744 RepID=UPI003EBAEE4F
MRSKQHKIIIRSVFVISIVSLYFFCKVSISQEKIDIDPKLKIYSSHIDENHQFPVVTGKSDAAKNINMFLKVKLRKFDQDYSLSFNTYQISAITDSFLSFSLQSNQENDKENLSFDSQGRYLTINLLFKEGPWLNDQVYLQRKQSIEKKLTEENLSTTQRVAYEECLKEGSFEPDFMIFNAEMSLHQDKLIFTGPYCIDYGERLKELNFFTNQFNYTDIASHLTPYGKCILIDKKTNCQPSYSSLTPGVWYGEINNEPFTLIILDVISYMETSVYGEYYVSNGKIKSVEGSVLWNEDPEKNEWYLENNEYVFKLNLSKDGILNGIWYPLNNPKNKQKITLTQKIQK